MTVKNTGQKKNNKGVYVFKKKSMMSAETKLTTIIEITNNCTFSMNFYSEMFNMKLPNVSIANTKQSVNFTNLIHIFITTGRGPLQYLGSKACLRRVLER